MHALICNKATSRDVRTTAILPQGGIQAAIYIFTPGTKREAEELDSSECQVQRADTFYALDGTEYDITALDDAQFEGLIEVVGNGTSALNYLETFQGPTLRKWGRGFRYSIVVCRADLDAGW
jgi:hypothetical protein